MLYTSEPAYLMAIDKQQDRKLQLSIALVNALTRSARLMPLLRTFRAWRALTTDAARRIAAAQRAAEGVACDRCFGAWWAVVQKRRLDAQHRYVER